MIQNQASFICLSTKHGVYQLLIFVNHISNTCISLLNNLFRSEKIEV